MIQNFIFYGIVGSGKGTQVKLLQNYLMQNGASDIVFVSTGNEYREIISKENFISKKIKEYLDAGKLLPNFLTNSIFSSKLLNNLNEDSVIVCDGYPRTISQSETFDQAMEFYNRNEVHIIYIKLSKEEATKRMKLRNRADDTDEGIASRFNEYENNVIPSMEYFRGKEGYVIHEINGEQSIEDVNKEIMEKLASYLK